MAMGLRLPPSKPERSPKSAKGRTKPPPTVFELPGKVTLINKWIGDK